MNGTDWTLEGYAELVAAVFEGGYTPSSFTVEPTTGVVYLRHDVDLSLDAALQMARLEAELDVRATYFLMTRSVFYNLASSEGVAAVGELRRLGHHVGLHAVWPDASLDDRFDPVVAWHNPDPETMSDPVPGAINVMGPERFTPATYRSDSNQRWRSGDPREELRAGSFAWLQLLIHPEIWVYPGETMGDTMRAMLDAEKTRRLEQLADDRIDLA